MHESDSAVKGTAKVVICFLHDVGGRCSELTSGEKEIAALFRARLVSREKGRRTVRLTHIVDSELKSKMCIRDRNEVKQTR